MSATYTYTFRTAMMIQYEAKSLDIDSYTYKLFI